MCSRWHQLGNRCEYCGYLAAPARFYWEDGKELPQAEAERGYLAWLGADKSGQGTDSHAITPCCQPCPPCRCSAGGQALPGLRQRLYGPWLGVLGLPEEEATEWLSSRP